MANLPDKVCTGISLHLSRVLDEIGLNELTVKQRRETSMYREHEHSLYAGIFEKNSMYVFGSQSEGSTTPGLASDSDFLFSNHAFKVIQNLTEWTVGETNLLMLQEGTAPGYCRLQLLKPNKPVPEETLPSQDYTYDKCNRVILKNSAFYKLESDDIIHNIQNGPAHTLQRAGFIDSDINRAFICTSRLDATDKWTIRKRHVDWPSARLIHQAVNEPFFLVPVGYKLSSTKSLEWRISTSLAERCLMHSLNIVQIKCYVILKILMKTYVTPEVENSISSYHCKTALLYCIESTDADFWREDNMLQCIHRCLEMLLDWIMGTFCPHFIIAHANLFAGKVTSENKTQIQCIFKELIRFSVNKLISVSTDRIGTRLLIKFGSRQKNSPILDTIETFKLLGDLELDRRSPVAMTIIPIHLSLCSQADASINIQKAITMLKYKTNVSDKIQQEANGHLINLLNNLHASFLASLSLGRNEIISKEALELLNASSQSNITYLLKQASVLYCSEELEHVERLCMKIDGIFKRDIIFPVCCCYYNRQKYSSEQYKTMYTKRLEVRFAYCVMFTPHEIHCVPQALRHELFKAVGDEDIKERGETDKWMTLAVIECLPLVYYLQYMTYMDIGKEELKQKSLHSFEQCIREGSWCMRHVETAWNILGQCYEMENQPVAALHCYRKSLDIRPRNNAANWLVPLLVFRCANER